MISAQTLRVCREGKPAPTFPDHALGAMPVPNGSTGRTSPGAFSNLGHSLKQNLMGSADRAPTVRIVPAPSGIFLPNFGPGFPQAGVVSFDGPLVGPLP